MRMSAKVRDEIEQALGSLLSCSGYDAQRRLERLLGYEMKIDERGDPIRKEAPDGK